MAFQSVPGGYRRRRGAVWGCSGGLIGKFSLRHSSGSAHATGETSIRALSAETSAEHQFRALLSPSSRINEWETPSSAIVCHTESNCDRRSGWWMTTL